MSILNQWKITSKELKHLISSNPSLRGMMMGYVAELHLKKYLKKNKNILSVVKPDDHDRKNKSDFIISYKNKTFRIESKSVQTNSINKISNGEYTAQFQCDASDCREIQVNNELVKTTSLIFGEFDIVAIPLFPFLDKWKFAFALNKDLAPTESIKYNDNTRPYLIKTTQQITYPLQSPYTDDIFLLLDKLIKEKDDTNK